MRYSEEDLIRMVEMRVKPIKLTGTLCKVQSRDLLMRAMIHLGVYEHDGYISNPYAELPRAVYDALTPTAFRLFADYNNLYLPPFTADEIDGIIAACKRFNYRISLNESRLALYRR